MTASGIPSRTDTTRKIVGQVSGGHVWVLRAAREMWQGQIPPWQEVQSHFEVHKDPVVDFQKQRICWTCTWMHLMHGDSQLSHGHDCPFIPEGL